MNPMHPNLAAIKYATDFGDGWIAFEEDRVVELGLPAASLTYSLAQSAPPPIVGLATALESYWKGGPLPDVPDAMFDAAERTALTGQIYRRVTAIPGGTVMTYGEVAASLHRPGAARAVGAAMAANRFAPMIPCHRVVGSDGSLRGYAAGIAVKRYLIEMEARVANG